MKELSLKEIQEIELEILVQFDSICQKNDLRYSLGGGTLLGAVRHKGFIPWDDDIDVMMPRPDYEKFLEVCKSQDLGFCLTTYDTVEGYNGLFAKIWDPKTIIIDDLMKMNFKLGVNIDIFPIDGLGDTKQEAIKIFKKTIVERELLNAVVWKRFFRSKTHSLFIEPVRLFFFLLSRLIQPKKLLIKIDEINKSHPIETSTYAGCVCGSYREREIMNKSAFENYIELEFEGKRFQCVKKYDEYLKKHYGNYMELPPLEKQKTHHTYRAFLQEALLDEK